MKDYYFILGVLPSAEDVVIAAAYRALAKRYHPDLNNKQSVSHDERMKEINEAYDVLSDMKRRQEYDRSRGARVTTADSFLREEPAAGHNGSNQNDDDWTRAAAIYPDILRFEQQLARYSGRLAATYRAYLLQEKQFSLRKKVYSMLEGEYLELLFGTNKEIQKIGGYFLQNGSREDAKDLAEDMRVLGSMVDVDRIVAKYQHRHPRLVEFTTASRLARRIMSSDVYVNPAGTRLLEEFFGSIGGTVRKRSGFWDYYWIVQLDDRIHEVRSTKFKAWFRAQFGHLIE